MDEKFVKDLLNLIPRGHTVIDVCDAHDVALDDFFAAIDPGRPDYREDVAKAYWRARELETKLWPDLIKRSAIDGNVNIQALLFLAKSVHGLSDKRADADVETAAEDINIIVRVIDD